MPSRAFRREKLQYKNSHSHKKISVWLSIFVLSSLLFSIPSAAAAEGDLDTSFGGDGIVTTTFGDAEGVAESIALQSDGKIVAAGYLTVGGNWDVAVVRYNADGSLDTSFDADGIVTTAIGAEGDFAESMALQSDGKILAAGASDYGAANEIAVVRYNTNGSLDTTFGTAGADGIDGVVTTSIGDTSASAFSITQQIDGKIVVAGASGNQFVLVRYNADGSLDTSFDADGIVTTAIGSGALVNSITLQSDGKIVAAGYSSTNINNISVFTVARYNTNGSLDTTFGTAGADGIDGVVTTSIGVVNAVANSIKLQSDGKIVAAGVSYTGAGNDIALVRYNADGSLDTSFDADGIVTTAFGNANEVISVALQSDGKIVAAGYSNVGGNYDFAVVRYNANGSLDTSFGEDGVVTTDVGNHDQIAMSVAIQSDGKIVAVGYSYSTLGYEVEVVRYIASNSAISQSITFPAVSDAVVGSTNTSANATASSGNNVVYRSNTNSVCTIFEGYWNIPGTRPITLLTVGTCSITAMEEGDATYAPAADVTRTFNVTAAVDNNAAAEVARVAAAKATAEADAAKKAKEQRELTELLSVIPSIAGLSLNLGDLANSLLTTTCVKGKTVKNVKKGAKCPKGYVKKK
jgi:uncharacterized delta-60 repeat protein